MSTLKVSALDSETSCGRQHGALDTLVEAVVPWCMLNGGVPWQ